MQKNKTVLIAHQSTIPHYRIPFYESVNRMKPDWWDFEVVYDKSEAENVFYMESADSGFKFNTVVYPNYSFNFLGFRLNFQKFIFDAKKYDLLVLGNSFNNISYPLTFIYKLFGKPIMYWGHGRDVFTIRKNWIKRIIHRTKLFISKRADGFFAYTEGVKKYLISQGFDESKIFTLHNTIDINNHRQMYLNSIKDRETIRKRLGFENKRTLMYVGRLNKEKKMDFLYNSFVELSNLSNKYSLILVGSGDDNLIKMFRTRFSSKELFYSEAIPDDELIQYYIASDLFVYPGAVGLGPIQALCYSLTPVVIEAEVHSPEYEYLNEINSVILPADTGEKQFAAEIDSLFNEEGRIEKLKNEAWSSIEHLSIDNMANNFIGGINATLNKNSI